MVQVAAGRFCFCDLQARRFAMAEQATPDVTGEVHQILTAIKGEMKRQEIQATLGLKHEDPFRKAYLVPALKAGLIEMTIPDKPRSKQKYRLTDKGRSAVG